MVTLILTRLFINGQAYSIIQDIIIYYMYKSYIYTDYILYYIIIPISSKDIIQSNIMTDYY